MAESVDPGHAIAIQVVFSEGCVNAAPTVERVRKVAAELGVKIALAEVRVETQEEADALRMLGSPTVQINGLDLDPTLRGETQYGFT